MLATTMQSLLRAPRPSAMMGCRAVTTAAKPLLDAADARKSQRWEKLEDGRTVDGIEYTPYTENSKTYDTRRVNPGIPIYLGNMAIGSTPLNQQDILDVGCGTGSFLDQVHTYVRSVTGIDYNEGMLGQAKKKFDDDKNASFHQGAAQDLPFDDNSFHAVTINQVMHHFSRADNYQEVLVGFREMNRVLKPGGVLIINTSSPEQQRDAFWWLSLFPENSKRMYDRFPPIATLKDHLQASNFQLSPDGPVSLLERPLMHPDVYLDGGYELAFDEVYRKADSSWEMPPDELEAGLGELKKMMDEGTAEAWLESREKLRLQMGQATLIIARKK